MPSDTGHPSRIRSAGRAGSAGRRRLRAGLVLLGWGVLTLAPPLAAGDQPSDRADGGHAVVWAAPDGTPSLALARPAERGQPVAAASFVVPASIRIATGPLPSRPSLPTDGEDVPGCRAVAHWCLAHATSTALS